MSKIEGNQQIIHKINDAKLTAREMDVISCIINGKRVKSIAAILGISPYTVIAHTRNIMRKLDCGSQDQLIKIIESSEQYLSIRDRYLGITAEKEFCTILQKIEKITMPLNLECEIYVLNVTEPETDSLVHCLSMAGISAEVFKINSPEDIPDNNMFHIIYSSSELANKPISNNLIFVQYLSFNNQEKLYSVCQKTPCGYYVAVLEMINLICHDKKVSQIINTFSCSHTDRNDNTSVHKTENRLSNAFKLKYIIRFLAVSLIFFTVGYYYYTHHKADFLIDNLPIMATELFIPRNEVTESMQRILEKQRGVRYVVLKGEAGIGKTVTARMFLKNSKYRLIWEISAESKSSIQKAFIEIADALANVFALQEKLHLIKSVSDNCEKERQIILFVKMHLPKMLSWSLLFDNVDDFDKIKQYMFHTANSRYCGDIIITTRNLHPEVFLSKSCVIHMKCLKDSEKKDLFGKISGVFGHQNIDSLLNDIPPMPLDVSIVANYFKVTGNKSGYYKNVTWESNSDFQKVYKQFLSRNVGYPLTRQEVLKMVFDDVLQNNKNFKLLLFLTCLLDAQDIPRKFLEYVSSNSSVDMFIINMQRHGLISLNEDKFCMHRSTQQIGLNYILNILSPEEKEECLNIITQAFSKYGDIIWIWYKQKKNGGLTIGARTELLEHTRSIINKLDMLKLGEKYKIKLMLAVLYLTEDIDHPAKRIKDLERIIKYNDTTQYITGYDAAVMLLEHAYLSSLFNCENNSEPYLEKCLELCRSLDNTDNITALCYAFLGRSYFSQGNAQRGTEYFNRSLQVANSLTDHTALRTKVYITNQYFQACRNYYVLGEKIRKPVGLLMEMLQSLHASQPFYKRKQELKAAPFFVSELRKNLAIGYNRLGEYDKAEECLKEVLFLYNLIGRAGKPLILREASVNIERAYSLMMKNNAIDSLLLLSNAINIKFKIHDKTDMFKALVLRAILYLHAGLTKRAVSDCKMAEKYQNSALSNFEKLTEIIYHYVYAFACIDNGSNKVNQQKIGLFLKTSKKFCQEFLDKETYELLETQKAFEYGNGAKHYLHNAVKIFAAIYGKDHSFVTNYVMENCKEHSWLYKNIRKLYFSLRISLFNFGKSKDV